MSFRAKRRISEHFFRLPRTVVELWLLFPIVTQIQPSRVYLFDDGNFPVAAPTLEFLLTRNRIAYVAKVFKPNDPGQVIPFRKAIHFSVSMLVQTAGNVICNANVQRGAVFVRENVHPIVVVTHRTRSNQRCFAKPVLSAIEGLNTTESFATDVTSLVGGQTAQTHRGSVEVRHPLRAARSLFA